MFVIYKNRTAYLGVPGMNRDQADAYAAKMQAMFPQAHWYARWLED